MRECTLVAATFGDPSGKQTVRVITVASLEQGDATPVAEFDFGSAVPDNFVFSPDGRYLYGSHAVIFGKVTKVVRRPLIDPLVYVDGRCLAVPMQ